MQQPTIPEYYANKCVFLTGATGFVGKVVIEKLLRCCPQIKTIYCLVRPKKGLSGEERLQDMLKQKCYERLRNEQPDIGDKVHAIAGDIMEPELGISAQDKQLLQDSVHIVMHSAATVRFTEHLRIAVEQNVVAVRMMVALCKTFHHLEAFVHVSTAYANCDRPFIDEKVYTPHIHAQKILDAFEWMDDNMIEAITPALLQGLPNTYTFSKQLGEQVLLEEGVPHLPVAIVRPSIVTAAWREPLPGWVDNYNGPSGLYVAYGKGLLHSFKGDADSVADLIPVDFPVNAIIAAAWHTGTHHHQCQKLIPQSIQQSELSSASSSLSISSVKTSVKTLPKSLGGGGSGKGSPCLASTTNGVVANGVVENGIMANGVVENGVVANGVVANGVVAKGLVPNGIVANGLLANGPVVIGSSPALAQPIDVYQVTSGGQNPFTWGEMQHMMSVHFRKYPLNACWRRPGKKQIFTNNSALHNYWLFVSHLMPAYVADLYFMLIGKKPRMVDVYRKLHKSMSTLEYFTEQSWEWTHQNLDLLRCSMTPEDQKVFYLDVRALHWPSYIEDYVLGTKKFVLKEELSTIPAARAHLRKLRNIRYMFNTLLLLVAWRLIIARSQAAHNTWHFFMTLFFKFVQFFKISSTVKR